MYQWLKNLFSQEKGISLFATQTGSGKSYTISKVLAESLDIENFRQTFIISPQVKLLHELRDKIQCMAHAERGERSSSEVLIVEASEQRWYKAFSNEAFVETLNGLTKSKDDEITFQKLKECYADYSQVPGTSDIFSGMRQDNRLQDYKKSFRKYLQKYFLEEFFEHNCKGNRTERCEAAIRKYPFLATLYPELTFHTYRIVGMTSSKLHQRGTSKIIDEGVMPYWNHIPEGALVIIDESDQCKVAGLNAFVDNVLLHNRKVDKWSLCNRLVNNYSRISNYFHEEEDAAHIRMRDSMIDKWTMICNHFTKRINLQENLSGCRLKGMSSGYGVVYHDRDSMTAHTKGMLFVEHNETTKTDYLVEAEGYREKHQLPVTYVDGALNVFISNFIKVIDHHIDDYEKNERDIIHHRVKTQGGQANYPSKEEIFKRLLNYIDITSYDDIELLREYRGRALYYSPSQLHVEHAVDKNSVYFKGISISEVHTTLGDSRKCTLNTVHLKSFPENVLIELARDKKCMVVLSSATADIEDPLHNYDLDYLTEENVPPTPIDNHFKKRMDEDMAKGTANPMLHVKVVPESYEDTQEKLEEEIRELVGYGSLYNDIDNFLKANRYMAAPLLNFIRFYLEFLADKDARGGLYVSPYSWTKKMNGEGSLSGSMGAARLLKILQQARKKHFTEEIKELDPEPDENTSNVYSQLNICFLSGNDFEKDKEYVCDWLSKDNSAKMLCMICYNSGNVGVNYEYTKNTADNQFVFAEKMRPDSRCNFDSIFIEHPTNYIACNDESPDSYLKACIDISLLEENKQLSVGQKKAFIPQLLSRKAMLESDYYDKTTRTNISIHIRKHCYQTKSYREYCMAQVLQALGRLTRTPISRKSVRIYMDTRIANLLVSSRIPMAATQMYREVLKKLSAMPEVSAQREKVLSIEEKQRKTIEFERNNENCNKIVTLQISKCNARYRNKDDKDIVDERRELDKWNQEILTYPTRDTLEGLSPEVKRFYCETDKVPESYRHPAKCSYLQAMTASPCVYEYFARHGYETKERPGKYTLYPSIIQQLYVGRIGEHVFRALLENAGFKVEALTDFLYEAADWMINKQVFVDVKFWAPNEQEQQSRIDSWKAKKARCGSSYAIVNVPEYDKKTNAGVASTEIGKIITIINGLVDVNTGEIDQENLNRIRQLINSATYE